MHAYWMSIHAAMALVVLRVINILLLKEYLDQPLVVLVWIVAGGALFLWARREARRTTPAARSRVQTWYAALDGSELALFGLLLVMVFLFHWGFARAASDGREYFIQVRSLIIDGDLDFANETTLFRGRGTTDIYAFGTPLLWTPFFLFAHLWLGVLNLAGAEYPRDGFFNPYQRAVGIGTLVYGFIALVLIYRILCQYYSKRLAALSTLAVTGGSFVIWYLVADNSLAHGTSMFAVALFLYTWHQTRGRESVRRWALLGATAGLMSLMRWQNVLFVVFPAADAIVGLSRSFGLGSRAPDNETTAETTLDDNAPPPDTLPLTSCATPHSPAHSSSSSARRWFSGRSCAAVSSRCPRHRTMRPGFHPSSPMSSSLPIVGCSVGHPCCCWRASAYCSSPGANHISAAC